jgi:hypothetical protein
VAAEWCGVVRNAFLILPAERNDTAAINSKLTTWSKSAQNRNREKKARILERQATMVVITQQ